VRTVVDVLVGTAERCFTLLYGLFNGTTQINPSSIGHSYTFTSLIRLSMTLCSRRSLSCDV
jgi:hypothetical protein